MCHPAATVPHPMTRHQRFLRLGLLVLALTYLGPKAAAQHEQAAGPKRIADRPAPLIYGPAGVYAKIPARDEFGRDQLAMFRVWNPDPLGQHEANLQAITPALAAVVRRTQIDNPELRLVIGSGRRDGRRQRMAVAWGWSRTRDSPHRLGNAVDLWPLDDEGQVYFDPAVQTRIASAVRKAATGLGVTVRWGGRFRGYKDMDRSHFELARP
ncbi:M15 family metallopeptidase [Microvirga terrestris]|uniref:M15 family metallopeptidase n=1 Tax=Microvirga terrestris TaxID=2791024 RepID=A0ABS0HWL5_9HYPH|nr:M15 family metallopeptidase [Microvirga terrestris]MBF9197906.1 M15 family metallopeptidase [Microvirga terrestris]